MYTLRYTDVEDLTGEDVVFTPDRDILIKVSDPSGELPTIYIDGTPIDNKHLQRVIDVIRGLRW